MVQVICALWLALSLVGLFLKWNPWLVGGLLLVQLLLSSALHLFRERQMRRHCECNHAIRDIWRRYAEAYKAWLLAGPAEMQNVSVFTAYNMESMLDEFRRQLALYHPVRDFGMAMYAADSGTLTYLDGAGRSSFNEAALPLVCPPGLDAHGLESAFLQGHAPGLVVLVAVVGGEMAPQGLLFMELEPGTSPDAPLQDSFELAVSRVAVMFQEMEVAGKLLMSKKDLESQAEKMQAKHLEVSENNRWLQEIALKDPLTGLANRRYLNHYLENEWLHCLIADLPMSVMLIDVDCFKQYNDRYGHQEGDHILTVIAGEIQASLSRKSDVAARYGGDEFLIVIPGGTEEVTTMVAQKILDRIRTLAIPHASSTVPGGIQTVSIGLFSDTPQRRSHEHASSYKEIVEKADQALYEAKRQGRNRYVVAS